MARRLALDIGATTVTARIRGGHGGSQTVLFDGAPSFPAAVCFDGNGACAGAAALAAGAGDPASYAGSPLTAVLSARLRYGGVERDPAELLMPVLSLALAHARDLDVQPPESISCVVPLGSMERLRAPMSMAARSLGLPDPSLIPEPVAAVLHATGGRGLPPGGTGVIVDAGGSAMEVTVLRGTESGAPVIVADHSDRTLGSDDVDARILAWLGAFLDRDNPPLAAALRAETNRTLLASLRDEVRRAKEDLARLPETEIAVTTLRGHGTVRLTRADLDRILADWSAGARALLARTLSEAGLPANGSVGCFVIGGGAHVPVLGPALAPIARLTFAHEPLTAAADGALIADDEVLEAIGKMDEAPAGAVGKRGPGAVKPPTMPKVPAMPKMPAMPRIPVKPPTMPKMPSAPASSPFLARTDPVAPLFSPGPPVPEEFVRFWPGVSHIAAEDADGTVWQWGELAMLALVTKPMPPRPVAGVPGPVAAASSGESFTVIVDAHGGATAWGANESNQLGVATTPAPKDAAVRPVLPATVTDVSCGTSHALAVTSDGHVLSWGLPLGGRLGNAAPMDIAPQAPKPVTYNVRDIVAVAAGRNHSLALDESGGLWGWGRDNRGQLGGAAGRGSPYPMRLPTSVPFVTIVAGKDFSLAIDGEGTVWSWGRNDRGQLGLGGPATRDGAGRVHLPAPAIRVFAAQGHAGAILVDGSLFTWGANDHGQLGFPGALRSFSTVPRPVTLPGGATAADAGGGGGYSACLTDDGKIFTWGEAHHGVDGSAARGTGGHVPVQLAGQPRN